MEGKLNFLFAILAVVLIAWVALMTYSCSSPATPTYLKARISLDDAITQADQNDKVVFALFSEEGNDACSKYKRRALADAHVVQWIAANARPVQIDMTKAASGDLEAAAIATRYEIATCPTVILLRKGRELGRLEGEVPAKDLLKWLTDHAAATPKG